MIEIWKIIEECPNYLISNHGRYKNIKTERILKNYKTKTSNYLYAKMYYDKKRIYKSIHRLVLMSFNPIKNMKKLQVNHINGIKTDNRLENLEWCTLSENIQHAYNNDLINRIGENNGRSKLKREEVWLIIKLLNSKIYKLKIINQKFIAKMFCVNQSTISRINSGKNWKHCQINKKKEI